MFIGEKGKIMFCTECGYKAIKGDSICRYCGTPLKISTKKNGYPVSFTIGGITFSFKTNSAYQLFQKSQEYLTRKDVKGSLEILNSVLSSEPRNPTILSQIGITYFLLHNFDKGIEYCKKAIEQDSTQILPLETLMEVYIIEGKPEKVKHYFENLKSLGAKYVYVLKVRASNCFKDHKPELAINWWKKALIFDPLNQEIISKVNAVAEQDFMDKHLKKFDNDYSKAIEFYKQKLEKDPNDDFYKRMVLWAEKRSLGLEY